VHLLVCVLDLAHPLVYHQVLFCHVDSGTPTSAQSQDNSPTDAPNPENRPKRSNGNDGRKQNRMNIIRFSFAMLTLVVFTIHSILFSAFVTVAPFRSVFWVSGINKT
jgi:hypothetical protein